MSIPENINKLLDKYYKKECNSLEKEIVERFFSKMQEDGLDPSLVKKDFRLRNRIYQNIQQQTISRGRRKGWITVISSAAAAILIGVVLFTQFWNTTSDTNMLIAKAAFGEQLQVTLDDASIVYLNSGSSLSYPESFDGLDDRTVILEGEGFFEVTKNPKQPFKVQSGSIITKVLGTKFVVNTFKSNYPEVIVAEGKVNVAVEESDKFAINLLPNEKVVYDVANTNFTKTKVKSENYAAWIHGDVVFNDSNIKDVGQKLERRFNIKVVLDATVNMDCTLSGRYGGDQLKELLESIQFVNGLEYVQTEDALLLQKISCP